MIKIPRNALTYNSCRYYPRRETQELRSKRTNGLHPRARDLPRTLLKIVKCTDRFPPLLLEIVLTIFSCFKCVRLDSRMKQLTSRLLNFIKDFLNILATSFLSL